MNLKSLKKITTGLSVLYVEDNVSVQQTMTTYLNKFFSLVVTASDGLEGLLAFREYSFDIVITDLSMPKMDGSEMIKEIRKLDENKPILITTAHTDSHYLIDAIKAHIDGYIIKPFDYNQLNTELYKVADKIKKYEENEAYKKHLKEMLKLQSKEINENYEKTLYSMIELIEQRDTYTAGHSKRVALYCRLIAEGLGYDEKETTLIYQAAIVHDIGKIETPDAVLLNPNKLNDVEYALIQEHVTVGYKLLKKIPMFEPMAVIVNQHHERYDGKGYPNGLKADEIDKLARIMIVADAFDAMTTNRIYKGRKSIAEAIVELKQLSKKQFHPDVVEVAQSVLASIVIDDTIHQLPKTKMEEEKFAYFYKDTLSNAYNQNYLDVILSKNSTNHNYAYMSIISLKKFSSYNKQYGWEAGDNLLKTCANSLVKHFNESAIFRVFGDDFVIMSKHEIHIDEIKTLFHSLEVSYSVDTIDLHVREIKKLSDIERCQL